MSASANRRAERLLLDVRQDLTRYPSLHATTAAGEVLVQGTFPVIGEGERELDAYRVRITLGPKYPAELPVVREVGGRIPWREEFHVNGDGTACVLIPDDRWRCFPKTARFERYLRVPLHNYFLGQHCFEHDGEWPFGQWGHGPDGIIEYYRHHLKLEDLAIIQGFLELSLAGSKWMRLRCACGSGKRVARCCKVRVAFLQKVSPARRKDVIEMLEIISVLSGMDG